MKKGNPFVYLLPLLFLAGAVVTWKFIIHPQIITWVESKIPEFNNSQNVFTLQLKKLSISLLKLQVTAVDVEVNFKNEYKKFESIKVAQIKAQINPFELLIGQLNVNSITLNQLKWSLPDTALTSSSKSTPEELPMDLLFKYLPQIPISKIKLLDSDIRITSEAKKLIFNSHINSAAVENLNYRLNLDVSQLTESIQSENNATVIVDLTLAVSLTANQLKINTFVVKGIESEVKVKGQLNQFKKVLQNPVGDFTVDSTILCDNVRTLYLSLFPQKSRLPSVSGKIQTTGKLSLLGANQINGQIEINTTNLTVDHFKFGKAQIKTQIKKNQVSIEQINLEHPAGIAELNQIEIQQSKPYLFKTKLNVKSFNLQKLFISLGMSSVPAELNLVGNAYCEGQLTPPFDIDCKTEATVSDVVVKANLNEKFSIVKFKNGEIKGNVLFNAEDLQFDSQVSIGKSKGLVKGIVDLEKGFKIDFETDQLDFKDIETLAGFDLKGKLTLSGSTSGDSDHGTIETEVTADDAEIEDFVVQHFSSELKYENGMLYFRNLNGKIGQSDYSGDLTFNFLKSNLSASVKSNQLHGEDLITALDKKFSLPFEISGVGRADVKVSGPFDFWKLKYDVAAFLKQGLIADEGFDQLDLNLSSDGKKIDFKDVHLVKAKSKLAVTGFIDTTAKQPEFNLNFTTNQASIEELDAAIKILPTLSGQIAVNGRVSGPLNSPQVKMDFNSRSVNLDGFDYPPSQGQLSFDKKYFTLDGQFFGRQLQAQIKWPWKEKDNFIVKLQVRDLNPLMLLPLVSLPQPNSEFYSRISFDVDLKSETASLQKATGQINLTDFLLQRGTQTLKLKTPAVLVYSNGLKKMDPVDLVGAENKISVHLLEGTIGHRKISLDVALKIRLLQFLVPFADSMNGQLTAQAQMSIQSGPLQIFGDGELTDGSFLLKGFPTAIDGISTPIEFSQSKIFLSDISAHIGPSEIEGAGQIEIKGSKNIIVQLAAQADNLEITFPDKISTAGRADLNFSGTWLPYTLKVNYKVARGLVEKDFGQDSASNVNLKSSHFLPPKQIESQTPSILLDVNVDLSQGVAVKNKLLEGAASGQLNIKGSPEVPIILGDIDIKTGSKIIFKDKPFEVQTARIHFAGGNDINPDIYISALARVSDYDISLLVQGPAKAPSIEATSQPPLSKGDIFSLLALGMTSTKMDQNLSSDAQQRQTGIEVIAALSNQSDFNKKLQQTLGLNVQLAPSVDSTKSIAVPKVVVSKQILKKLNASYSKPLTGDQNQEVKLQYLFNPHLSGILNYQNKESNQQDNLIQTQDSNGTGVLGGEFEYKKEFKW